MSEQVRLYIVTDDPRSASLQVIGCFPSELPPFFRLVTSADEVANIPDGARVERQIYQKSSRELAAACRSRRFAGVTPEFRARIHEWNEKRIQAERELVAEALRDPRFLDSSAVAAPEPALPETLQSSPPENSPRQPVKSRYT